MERVIYCSKAAADTHTADVFQIIEVSERNNPDRAITGFLICNDNRFFQLIEGPESALTTLLETLRKDPRHHSIEILDQGAAAERMFPDWSMKQLISFNAEPALVNLRKNLLHREGGNQVLDLVDQFLDG